MYENLRNVAVTKLQQSIQAFTYIFDIDFVTMAAW